MEDEQVRPPRAWRSARARPGERRRPPDVSITNSIATVRPFCWSGDGGGQCGMFFWDELPCATGSLPPWPGSMTTTLGRRSRCGSLVDLEDDGWRGPAMSETMRTKIIAIGRRQHEAVHVVVRWPRGEVSLAAVDSIQRPALHEPAPTTGERWLQDRKNQARRCAYRRHPRWPGGSPSAGRARHGSTRSPPKRTPIKPKGTSATCAPATAAAPTPMAISNAREPRDHRNPDAPNHALSIRRLRSSRLGVSRYYRQPAVEKALSLLPRRSIACSAAHVRATGLPDPACAGGLGEKRPKCSALFCGYVQDESGRRHWTSEVGEAAQPGINQNAPRASMRPLDPRLSHAGERETENTQRQRRLAHFRRI